MTNEPQSSFLFPRPTFRSTGQGTHVDLERSLAFSLFHSISLLSSHWHAHAQKSMNSHAFNIQPLQRFSGSNAAIRRPKVNSICFARVLDVLKFNTNEWLPVQEIACFSYDDEHNFRLDESSLKYYYPPLASQMPADLNEGFETFQKLDDAGDEHLDALLDTVVALEENTGSKCEADIITWRGMMTKVRGSFFLCFAL